MQKFKKSAFSTQWEGPFQTVEIEYTTPDFSTLTPTIWGDWGPNYHFQLDARDPFIVNYKMGSTNESITLNLKEVTLESPISKALREKFPLKLKLHDAVNGFISELYFDHEGEISKVDISYVNQDHLTTSGAVECFGA